ncbi:MAG: ATP-binding protein [Desulfuromonadales bacterium GWD2_61_12]|nr:MAG: ATP-binding protein [Desulfuromonadales bacterium GWC2_61_20]OGR35935.1 MAG: ATP-binding protein [Desulfuromonadales bacterium GWD2_61_12]HAD03789.1 ATP-binding protein [Desulfuromonas sp.]HBT81991.1 ATP-binding protein [Desulfuromonas sp.]
MSDPLIIAKGSELLGLLPKMANRHGLIAGATGTGKTVTLRVLAEQFSRAGVPVFMADVKGDLTGLAQAGGDHPKVQERVAALKLDGYAAEGYPVVFWDLFGAAGHPVRTTVSEMGPLLLARLFDLNDTQEGVLSLVFKIADDQGMLLLDLKDLQEMVRYVGDHAGEFRTSYGNISAASIGAIQRSLLTLEQQGGGRFFGEPALDLDDFIQTGAGGRGVINILAADQLMQTPKLYATFLLWLLAELFERLPEAGDPEKPKLVFFFDEAHLLFDNPPKALLEKIEQVVRLIRSKGVGVYFVTQNPLDIPEEILGQLGNRVQHALRAFTPKDQKAVRAAAETFRARPGLDVATAIMELGTGEALVSLLDAKGAPNMVERALVAPPRSRLQPLDAAEKAAVINGSPLAGHYERQVDRESAYEKLKTRAAQVAAQQPPAAPRGRSTAPDNPTGEIFEAAAKSAARAIGSQVGRQIIRGILGSLFGGRR